MQSAYRIHHRAHRVQVFRKRVSSFWFHHEVGAVISQSSTDGAERTTGIDHIVDGVKGSDDIELGVIRVRSGGNALKLNSVSHPVPLCLGSCPLQGFFTDIKTVE